MRPFFIIELDVLMQTPPQLGHRFVVVEIDVLILQCAPEALDEDVVEDPTTTIHADTDLLVGQTTGKIMGSKLRSLVGVENLWFSLAQGLFQRCQSEVGTKSPYINCSMRFTSFLFPNRKSGFHRVRLSINRSSCYL